MIPIGQVPDVRVIVGDTLARVRQCSVIATPNWPKFRFPPFALTPTPFKYGVMLVLRPTGRSTPRPSTTPVPVTDSLLPSKDPLMDYNPTPAVRKKPPVSDG